MKFLTMTSPDYHTMTQNMIASSGVKTGEWEIMAQPQAGTGDWNTPWFNNITCLQTARILELLKDHHDVFFCDGDVHWLKPIRELAIDSRADIAAQHDPDSGLCTGVIFYRATPKVISLLEAVLATGQQSNGKYNDQMLLNHVLRSFQKSDNKLQIQILKTVLSFGLIRQDNSLWDGQEFEIPENCHAFHANYTIGIKNKERLIRYVQYQV